MPNGLVHVGLVDFDGPSSELDLVDAVARRDAVDVKYKATYLDPGHEQWFFHAFDRSTLDFVVARWEPTPPLGGRYVAVQRFRVARTPEAVRAFSLERTIADYESGTGGVKAGMKPEEVRAIKGAPDRENQLGPFGAFDWIYGDEQIRFLQGRVAHVFSKP